MYRTPDLHLTPAGYPSALDTGRPREGPVEDRTAARIRAVGRGELRDGPELFHDLPERK